MNKLILTALMLPIVGVAALNRAHSTSINLVEVRSGAWPINLERNVERRDTSYSLIFRDEEVANGIVLDTLPFPNLGQLKFFGKALTTLKTGNNGDIAKFKDYSIKRTDNRYQGGTWYILRYQWGLTNFQQPEADILRQTIKSL